MRFYIKQEYLDAYVYTQHCPKCQNITIHGNEAKSTVPHSEQCRARITAEVAKTEGGQDKLQKVLDKTDRYDAEHIKESESQSDELRGGEVQ